MMYRKYQRLSVMSETVLRKMLTVTVDLTDTLNMETESIQPVSDVWLRSSDAMGCSL